MATPSRPAARPRHFPPSAAVPAAPSPPSLREPVSVLCICKRVEWRRAVRCPDVNINVSLAMESIMQQRAFSSGPRG